MADKKDKAEKPVFKRGRAIVRKTISTKGKDSVYFRVMEKVRQGKRLPTDAPDKEPADLLHVVDLETGEEADLICPTVLSGIFKDMEAAGQDYVGKSFECALSQKAGKKYKGVELFELED